jgi:hypothetical protein
MRSAIHDPLCNSSAKEVPLLRPIPLFPSGVASRRVAVETTRLADQLHSTIDPLTLPSRVQDNPADVGFFWILWESGHNRFHDVSRLDAGQLLIEPLVLESEALMLDAEEVQ